ncbi:MAG: transposase [Burkholderia sp.]
MNREGTASTATRSGARGRKVHLAVNANTGQVHAALMTHQNVADGDVLAKLLDQIPHEKQIDVIGGDGAYDTKPCHAAIAARRALLHKSSARTQWHRRAY